MRVLLDECVPWPIRRELPAHAVDSVPRRGWAGIGNGRLLALAEPHFDLFITSDQNLAYQQNLTSRRLAILQMSTNKLRRLQSAADLIRATVDATALGTYRVLDIP